MRKTREHLKAITALLIICILSLQFGYSYAEDTVEVQTVPPDGVYNVNIALWHQVMDKPSMGNKGLMPEAEIQIKDGKLTMFMETQIIQVTGITASLVSFFYFDESKQDFVKAEARAYNFEIDGQKRPQIFIFPITYGQEYYRCMVDPKVEVMGDKPIEARLKVDWNSLKKIDKSVKQDIIDKTAQSDIEAKIELKKQEIEAAQTTTNAPKQKHLLMEVKPIQNMSMPVNPIGEIKSQNIADVDFTQTVDYENDQATDEDERSGEINFKSVEPKERPGIIFGVLSFLILALFLSIFSIVIYIKKIVREYKRAGELDIFEGELHI